MSSRSAKIRHCVGVQHPTDPKLLERLAKAELDQHNSEREKRVAERHVPRRTWRCACATNGAVVLLVLRNSGSPGDECICEKVVVGALDEGDIVMAPRIIQPRCAVKLQEVG